ncbi:hypothetical protein NIES25_41780 [Nostoc linckia NIES-25]|nr:hypothetical protein NIES25_41780 [Nostoc linckia NIES-25]
MSIKLFSKGLERDFYRTLGLVKMSDREQQYDLSNRSL